MLREATAHDLDAAQFAFRRDVPATFDPAARWIWDDGESSPRNAWRLFRREVTLAAAPASATLRVTADTRYTAWVNGVRIGQGPVRGFAHRWMVDDWEIGPYLQAGANAVAILVIHHGVSTFMDAGNQAGLLAQIEVEGSNPIVTDASWRVLDPAGYDPRSNRISCQLGFVEQLDARAFPPDWTESGFDDSAWPAATGIAEPGGGAWPNLVARDIPHLQETRVRPTHVERLAYVRPFPHAETIDLRNHMDPASARHANHIAYAGYIVSVIRVIEEDEITVAMPWSWFNGIAIDGNAHHRDDLMFGPGTQRSLTKQLAPGDHWLVIEVSREDHGDGFQVAVDSAVPGTFSLVSPLGDDAGTAYVTLSNFTAHDPGAGVFPIVPPIPDEIAAAARSIASREDFDALSKYLRPVEAAHVSRADIFTLLTQPRERVEQPIPAALQAVVSGNPAVIPVQPGRDTDLIFDLGREFSGFITFEIDAPAGVTIDIYGFEYLRGGHRENTWRLDNSLRYVTREGRQQYTSPVRRGMRFLQVAFRGLDSDRETRLHDIAVIESHFPVSQVGAFRCSDARLDQIWEMSRRTVLACMEDTYVDCPAFEQTYWVGDAYNSARFAAVVFGAEALTERCVRLVPGSAGQTPYMASQVPSGWVNVIPNWTFFWAMTARSHWFRTGDSAFAADLWPPVQAALGAFLDHVTADGVLDIAAWNLLDWAPIDQPNEGIVAHQNCLMVIALDAAADLAEAAGDGAGAARMRSEANRMRNGINAVLWSDEHNGYIDAIHADGHRSDVCSVQTHMFALLAGIPDGDRAARCEAVLLDPPENWVRIGSPWMSAFLYDELAHLGRAADALGDIRLNYGMMLDHGATTCWEVYPTSPVAGWNETLTRSHCHAWSAAPVAFLPDWVLGIRPAAAGWTKVLVAPDPCGLEWAEGAVPLPGSGRIEASWRITDGRMRLDVRAPAGIEIDARLPDGIAGEIEVHRIP